MLLDSNIIVYSTLPEHSTLRAFIAANNPVVSAVSYVEVMGYHRLTAVDRAAFERFFNAAIILPIDQPVLDKAIALRQQRRMSLGDSLIAGTALVHSRVLVTSNIEDFRWIDGLKLHDPMKP
jgi:hypothetical protein